MKKIEAIIRSQKLESVREALLEADLDGLTVMEVRVSEGKKGHLELYRGTEYKISLLSKAKIEIIVGDDDLDLAIETITEAAKTGAADDGKIFISTIDEAIHIRSEETAVSAL
jgi:nitrogen regulatory protein P-II 1